MNRGIPKPYTDAFTDEQMEILQRYAKTLLAKNTVDTDALYGDDFDKAMLELARVAYAVAEHFDMPYVTAWAFCRDGKNGIIGHAFGQKRDTGEFTNTMRYAPQEGER